MKKLIVVMGIAILVMLSSVSLINATPPDQANGAVFQDQILAGTGFALPPANDEWCLAFWGFGDLDVNDFIRINPDGIPFSTLNIDNVQLTYQNLDTGDIYTGHGKYNRNYHATIFPDPEVAGVWMHARGEVTNGVETKKLNCMYAVDEETGELTTFIKLK